MDKNYDFAIDIWSIGCIMGELLLNFIEHRESLTHEPTSSKEYHDALVRLHMRYLFPGDSCYPLSPIKNPRQSSSVAEPPKSNDIEGTMEVSDND